MLSYAMTLSSSRDSFVGMSEPKKEQEIEYFGFVRSLRRIFNQKKEIIVYQEQGKK